MSQDINRAADYFHVTYVEQIQAERDAIRARAEAAERRVVELEKRHRRLVEAVRGFQTRIKTQAVRCPEGTRQWKAVEAALAEEE